MSPPSPFGPAQRADEEWLSISEAARRLDLSRRTVRRRIEAADVETRQQQVDGRIVRLVRLADIEHLQAQPAPAQPDSWQETIDQALATAFSAYARVAMALHQEQPDALDLARLRAGPLGRDLAWLAALAQGDVEDRGPAVVDRIDRVLRLLFVAPLSLEYAVPPAFWDTGLGRLISVAKLRAFDAEDLMTVGEAAMRLRVTRPTIYRWMDEDHLRYVRDECAQRTLIVRQDVEDLLRHGADGRQPDREASDSRLSYAHADD